MSASHPILLQKSKVADLRIFRENTKREAIADSYNLNRVTEVACEFNVRRRGPSHLYTNAAPVARRIFDHQCKTTFATKSPRKRTFLGDMSILGIMSMAALAQEATSRRCTCPGNWARLAIELPAERADFRDIEGSDCGPGRRATLKYIDIGSSDTWVLGARSAFAQRSQARGRSR